MIKHPRFQASICAALLSFSVFSSAQAVRKTLIWTAPTTNTDNTPAVVDNYNLYRSVDGGVTFTKLAIMNGTITTFADPNVPSGRICYEVTAMNGMGESARSNRACFSLPTAPPSPPTALSGN